MSFVTLNWLNPPYIIQALRYLDFKIQRLQMRVVPDFIDLMHASCFFFFFLDQKGEILGKTAFIPWKLCPDQHT